MKKTLAAAAVLGVFAGSTLAANVTLYGSIDLGFGYRNSGSYTQYDGSKVESSNSFAMESGKYAPSRWGIKGTEKLTDDVTLGFVLESGIFADNGAIQQTGRLFGRECFVYLTGSFGEISFGRETMFSSGTGRYGIGGLISGMYDEFPGIGASNYMVGSMSWNRADNMVTYLTPVLAGLKLGVQFSGDLNGSASGSTTDYSTYEWKSNLPDSALTDVDYNSATYASAMAQYKNGPFMAMLIADYFDWKHKAGVETDEGLVITAGINYDFGSFIFRCGGQYFKDMVIGAAGSQGFLNSEHWMADSFDIDNGIDNGGLTGYSVMGGFQTALAGGTFQLNIAYLDADIESVTGADGKNELKRYGGGVTYLYPLSKSTMVYATVGYTKDKLTYSSSEYTSKPGWVQSYAGIRHVF